MLVFGLKMLVLSQNTTIKEKFTRHIPKNGSKKPAPACPKQAQNWKNKIYCNLSEMSDLSVAQEKASPLLSKKL
jgi:hypothetical protein